MKNRKYIMDHYWQQSKKSQTEIIMVYYSKKISDNTKAVNNNIDYIYKKVDINKSDLPWGDLPIVINKNYIWIEKIFITNQEDSYILNNYHPIDDNGYWYGFLTTSHNDYFTETDLESLCLAKMYKKNNKIFIFPANQDDTNERIKSINLPKIKEFWIFNGIKYLNNQ